MFPSQIDYNEDEQKSDGNECQGMLPDKVRLWCWLLCVGGDLVAKPLELMPRLRRQGGDRVAAAPRRAVPCGFTTPKLRLSLGFHRAFILGREEFGWYAGFRTARIPNAANPAQTNLSHERQHYSSPGY